MTVTESVPARFSITVFTPIGTWQPGHITTGHVDTAGPRKRLAAYRLAQERRDILRVLTGLVERRLKLMRGRKLIGNIKSQRRLSLRPHTPLQRHSQTRKTITNREGTPTLISH